MSRMGQGLPVGADLEYADELTLRRALEEGGNTKNKLLIIFSISK